MENHKPPNQGIPAVGAVEQAAEACMSCRVIGTVGPGLAAGYCLWELKAAKTVGHKVTLGVLGAVFGGLSVARWLLDEELPQQQQPAPASHNGAVV